MRKQILVVSTLTIVSQLAALLKLWFTARIFGVGAELDGYNLALVLPTLIAGVMAGVVQTGIFPVRAALNAAGDTQAVERFERATLLGMLALGVVITLVLLACASFIVSAISQSATESVQTSLRYAFPFLAILVAMNFVGDSCGFLLAMRDRFAIAAGAPLANGLLGASMLAVWPEGGLTNLIAGTVLGLGLQVSLCLWGLKTTGFSLVGSLPALDDVKRQWIEMLRLGQWILPGVVFSNMVVALPMVWVAKYGEGAVSAFGYAYRLHSSALQFLVMASSTVILARFSDLVAQNKIHAIRSILVKSTLISMAVGVVGTLLVFTVGASLLHELFGGRFDMDAAAHVTKHWILLTVGIAFAMMGNVFAKLWQAQGRPLLMSMLAGISLVVLFVVHTLFDHKFMEYSLSAGLSAASIVSCIFGFWYVRYVAVHSNSGSMRN